MADDSGTTVEQRELTDISGPPRPPGRPRIRRLKLILAAGFAAFALVNLGFWIAGRVRIEERIRTMHAAKIVLMNIEGGIRTAIEAGNTSPAEAAASLSAAAIPASDLKHIPFSTVHVRSNIQPWTSDSEADTDDDLLRNDDRILVWAELTGRPSDE